MNNWNQPQNQNYNFNSSMAQYGWPQQRLPIYNAAPIHGETAAWQFPMGPGSEIWLPDDEKDIIWWIRTDNIGNRTVKAFKLGDYEEPKSVDINDLVARLTAVEEWINAKQNKPNAKRTTNSAANAKPANTANTTE